MRRALAIFLGAYALLLIFLLPFQALWVDEIIDLSGVRAASDVHGVLAFVPGNAGGVPLGYLVDFAMIRTFGYSVAVVRLPSVFFTVLACVGVFMLARRIGLRWPLLAVALYAASPMTLRYALETRPYAQAACCSVFASVIFVSLVRQPSAAKAAGYAALIAAGLYAQPYSVFVPVAHLVWIVFVSPRSRSLWFAAAANGAAALAFLPWFVKTHAAWQGALNAGVRFNVNARDLLVIPHELMGTGYAGAALAAIAVLVAVAASSLPAQKKLFLSLYMLLLLVLVPAADAYFGYFLAARQMIFALVPISILIAACCSVRWGWVLPVAMLGAMLYEDLRWARRPGEGWQPAAAELMHQTAEPAGCVVFVPPGSLNLYAFFEPQLQARQCRQDDLAASDHVIMAVGLGASPSGVRQQLDRAGFHKAADLLGPESGSDPRLELYRK